MDALDITRPDAEFTATYLINQWEKVNYQAVTDTHLRTTFNEVKELSLCQLCDPPSAVAYEDDPRHDIHTTIQDILGDMELPNPLPPCIEDLHVITVSLVLATMLADTTLKERLGYVAAIQALCADTDDV